MSGRGRRQSEPWDRQPGESAPAWAAFAVYRDMGPARSLAKAGQSLGKSKVLLEGWSSKHAWVLRAAGWDAEQDREWQAELKAKQRRAVDRNVNLAGGTMQILSVAVASLAGRPEALKPGDIARLMDSAGRIEQNGFAAGLSTPATPVGADGLDDVDLDSLTDEEIRFHLVSMRNELDAELADYPDVAAGDTEQSTTREEDR